MSVLDAERVAFAFVFGPEVGPKVLLEGAPWSWRDLR